MMKTDKPAFLKVATYNIHKGVRGVGPGKRLEIHNLALGIEALDTDLVFLQEVQGLHLGHAENHDDWPASPQHEFLAEDVWTSSAYGRNMIYDHGHHGNAILRALAAKLFAQRTRFLHGVLEKRG